VKPNLGQLEAARLSSPAKPARRAALSTSVSIFNQFYAAQNGLRVQGPGAGLGLAINRRIAASRRPRNASNPVGPSLRAGNQPGQRVLGSHRKSDYLLIVDSEAPFGSKLLAELVAAGLETYRTSDAESARQLAAGKSRPTIVLDLRFAALPIAAALLIGEALAR
jgi:hypothetical protein